MNNELDQVKKEIEVHRGELAEKYSVKKIGVFGSVAKGLAGPDSDVDMLVEFEQPIGLFKFENLRFFLEDCFKKKVDLATPRAIKPLMREEVMRSVIYI